MNVAPPPHAAVPGDALARLRSLISPYSGLGRNVVEFLRAPDESRLVTFGVSLADTRGLTGEATIEFAGSAHWDRDRALAGAIGEAAERYAATFLPDDLVTATADELSEAVDPESFSLFHEQQYAAPGFPFARFDRHKRVSWARGVSVPDGRPVFLPAELVYMRRPANDGAIAYVTSNGLACGPTFEEAVLGGLCELIERDAVMIAWYNRLSLPRLEWSPRSETAEAERRYFAPTRLSYSAVDLSCFFDVPAALGVVHAPREFEGALAIGAGCAPTMEEAWRKALAEAFGVHRWLRDICVKEPGRRPAAGELRTFDDHLLYYAGHDRARLAAFLDSSPTIRRADEIAPICGGVTEQIAEIARRLAAHKVSIYAVDVTTVDVAEAGLRVVRVIAPELSPLDVLDGARYLGGTRLYRAAYEAGLVARPFSYDDLNPHPHPFP